MKSIEKLQKQVDELQAECEARGRALESNLKRIHELESECSECCYKQEFDNIEQRYMPLPLDADGVPWHIGDEIEGHGVLHSMSVNRHGWSFFGTAIDPAIHRHVKPDPLKELLCDMIHEYGSTDALTETVADKYADCIRELTKEGGDD